MSDEPEGGEYGENGPTEPVRPDEDEANREARETESTDPPSAMHMRDGVPRYADPTPDLPAPPPEYTALATQQEPKLAERVVVHGAAVEHVGQR